jgi:prevent-host-death family protein
VGIRELKAKLSHYLERAAAGETIVVTDRGKAKAEIRQLSGEERLADRIQRGIEEGWIRPGRPRSTPIPSRGVKAKRTIAEVMAEDREE